jgi:hypothetical protein
LFRRRCQLVVAAAAVRLDATLLNHVRQAVLAPSLLARHRPPNRLVPEWFAMFFTSCRFLIAGVVGVAGFEKEQVFQPVSFCSLD